MSTDYVVRVYSTEVLADGMTKVSMKVAGSTSVRQKTEETELTAENFKVVLVNLDGSIAEEIPVLASQITKRSDGSYSINVPGVPRLDCVIIADISKPVVLPTTGSLFDTDLLLAPTTDTELDLDLGSTVAYAELLDQLGGTGTFDSIASKLNVSDASQLQALKDLIVNVQQTIENQVFTSLTLEAAKAAIKTAVTDIITQEVQNINSQVESTLVTALASGGGIHWYDGLTLGEVFHGAITSSQAEQQYYYNGTSFELYENDYSPDMMLSSSAWVVSADRVSVFSSNQDGSVTLTDSLATQAQINAKAAQAYNLEGRNIAEFFNANTATKALAGIVDPSSTFGAGATGYRINLTAQTDEYRLWYNAGDETGVCEFDADKNANDYGGSCETVNGQVWNTGGWWDFSMAFTSLNNLFSTDAGAAASGSKLLNISWLGGQQISVQLINDANKTAHYYLTEWADTGFVTEALGDGVWAYITLPGLTGDEAQAIVLDVPEDVQAEGDFDSPHVLLALHNGYVREGNIHKSGEIFELGTLVLNGTAADAVEAASDYKTPLVGSWTKTNAQGVLVAITALDNQHVVRVAVDINDNSNCGSGIEVDNYGLGLDTSIKLNSIYKDIGACGFGTITASSINNDVLSLTVNGTSKSLDRLVNSGITGSWFGESDDGQPILLTLLGDNHFIFSHLDNEDGQSGGIAGYEYGSFTYDANTEAFVPTVSLDTDGSWGFVDNGTPDDTIYSLSLEGDSLTITFTSGSESGSVSFQRVTQ